MSLITVDEATSIRDELLALFSSVEAYEASVRRFRDKFPRPTASQFRRWMLEDLEVDRAMHGAAPRGEPLLPLRQSFELSDCRHCGGMRYVRADVPVGHADFGRALPCEFCTETHDKTACATCRKPRSFSGYFGPETATVPADWDANTNRSIPPGWTPRHDRHGTPHPIPPEVYADLERLAAEKAQRQAAV